MLLDLIMTKNKDKLIEEFYRLIWDSLQSHLGRTYEGSPKSRKFHKQCVRDYTRMMELLNKLT